MARLSGGYLAFVPWREEQLSITFVLQQPSNYGLTTGQRVRSRHRPANEHSPTASPAYVASMDLIFSSTLTFVARVLSGDIKLMTSHSKAAIPHRGFAFNRDSPGVSDIPHFATHEYLWIGLSMQCRWARRPVTRSRRRRSYAGSGSHQPAASSNHAQTFRTTSRTG